MITNKEAIRLLNVATKKFPIDFNNPEYREFTCARCYRKVRKAWHIHCHDLWWKREIHLCFSCGKKYKMRNITDDYKNGRIKIRRLK